MHHRIIIAENGKIQIVFFIRNVVKCKNLKPIRGDLFMLSERARKIKPSPTLAIDAKAKAMKSKGIDIVNFGVGEPDFDTPENVKEAAIKAIKDGFTKYTPVGGIETLKDAIIGKFVKDNALSYERENIIVSSGAKHSLYNIAQALLSPGDEVLILSPYGYRIPTRFY